MTDFIVEDGTGLGNATSYASIAQLDAYHAAFLNTDWAAASQEAKEKAAMEATRYLDWRYVFRGEQVRDNTYGNGQALAWPRAGYPWPLQAITSATAELALRALAGPLVTDESERTQKSVKVGPIAVSFERGKKQQRYSVVDTIVKPFVLGGMPGQIRIHRT